MCPAEEIHARLISFIYLLSLFLEYYHDKNGLTLILAQEMDQCHQKEAAQGSVAAAEPGQSPPPGRCATLLGRGKYHK